MATKNINTSGKRKKAVARVSVTGGKGRVRINSQPLEIYQPELARLKITEALLLSGARAEKVDISVSVEGGGIMGQANAVRTGIARGLVEFFTDEELKDTYLAVDRTFLVNDTRRKEPKHQLGPGARSKKQKSYR